LSAASHSGKETPVNVTPSPPDGPPPLLESQPAGAGAINRRRWWVHLLLISGYTLLVGVFGREHSGAHAHIPALSHTVRGLLIECTIGLLCFALVLGLAVVTSRASRDDLLLRWRHGFWPLPLGIGYSVALRLAVAMIMMVAGVVLIVTHVMSTIPPGICHRQSSKPGNHC
jgi:hypothetical protein